jgi:SAM-dependent methyltransferase
MGVRPESPGREYARRFALEHAHYRDDLAFWAALADELGGPVLDVGAATGRVAIELARRGHEVWAVDPSPDMRAELLAALAGEDAAVAGRVRVRDGRLEGLSLGRRFPLVVVAMNTMQVLLGEEDRRAAFASLAEHLAPGGRIAFDVARVSPAEAAASIGFEVPIGEHRPAGPLRDPDRGRAPRGAARAPRAPARGAPLRARGDRPARGRSGPHRGRDPWRLLRGSAAGGL